MEEEETGDTADDATEQAQDVYDKSLEDADGSATATLGSLSTAGDKGRKKLCCIAIAHIICYLFSGIDTKLLVLHKSTDAINNVINSFRCSVFPTSTH